MHKLCQRLLILAPVIMMLALTLLIYHHTLDVPFLFDDWANIEYNRITWISWDDPGAILEALANSPNATRPLANLSFALNHRINGMEVAGYHRVNIALHLVSGLLIAWIVVLTLSLSPLKGYYPRRHAIALFVALLWLVNPIQTQTVTYIVQRMNGMAVMFYLLAIALYLQGRLSTGTRRRLLLVAVLVAWLLALGSKEIAATLPLLLLLYEWYFFQDLNPAWLRRWLPRLTLVFGLCGVIALSYLGWPPWEQLAASYAQRDFSLGERLLTESRVVIYYLSLLLYPAPERLALEHDITLSQSLFDPLSTLAAVVALIVALTTAIRLARSQRLLSFCILWYLGHLLIESSILPLELIFEHRSYLPSVGVFLLLVASLSRLPWPTITVYSLLGIIALTWSYWTYQRNDTWRDDQVFWQDNLNKAPNNLRVKVNLGTALDHHGHARQALRQFSDAIDHFEAHPSVANKHTAVTAYQNRAALYQTQAKWRSAIHDYNQALQLDPSNLRSYVNRAMAREQLGELEQALDDYDQAIQRHMDMPTNSSRSRYAATLYHGRAKVRLQLGQTRRGLDDLDTAIRLWPTYSEAWGSRGNLYRRLGKPTTALDHYQHVLRLSPDDPLAHLNLGTLWRQQGNLVLARIHLQRAWELAPGKPHLRKQAAALLRDLDTSPKDQPE